MSDVLFIVADPNTLTAGDQQIVNLLDGTDTRSDRSDTVTLASGSDDFTAVGAYDPYDFVVASETTSSSTLTANHPLADVAVPLVLLENGAWDEYDYITSGASTIATNDNSHFVLDDTHPLAAGYTGTNQFHTAAGDEARYVNTSDLGGDAEEVWSQSDSTTANVVIFAYPIGAAMANGGTAPAMRIAVGDRDAAYANLTNVGRDVLLAAFAEADGSFRHVVPDGTVDQFAIALFGPGTPHEAIDDDPLAGNTASRIENFEDNNSFVVLDVSATPSDLDQVDELAVRVLAGAHNTGDDTVELYAQVFRSDGTTPLTDRMLLGGHGDFPINPDYAVVDTLFTGVDATATKADWDGAVLSLEWEYVQTGGLDDMLIKVADAELNGTYSAAQAAVPFTAAGETDAAEAVQAAASPVPFAAAGEVDAASAVQTVGTVPFVAAPETDGANPVAAVGTVPFAAASEVDAAEPLPAASATVPFTASGETDASQPLPVAAGAVPFTAAVETDAAGQVAATATVGLAAAPETDDAGPVVTTSTVQVAAAGETDAAEALPTSGAVPWTSAVEVDAAGAVVTSSVLVMVAAGEDDVAGALLSVGPDSAEPADEPTSVAGIGTATVDGVGDAAVDGVGVATVEHAG